MSFAEGFVRAHREGQQQALEQEQRSIDKMLLEHKLRQMKIEDKLKARDLAKQNFDMLSGQPAADLPGTVVARGPSVQYPGGGAFSPGISVPQVEKQFTPVTIPGVSELGVPDVSVRPQSQEQISSAEGAKRLRAMMDAAQIKSLEPYTLGTGQQRVDPLAGTTTQGTSKEEPEPSAQIHQGIVDGKPGAVIFNPKTQMMINLATGQPTTDFHAPESASQLALGQDVKLTSQQKKIALDLSSGDLTFDQFNRLYPSRSGAGAATKQAIYYEATQQNPNFNPAQFEIGYKFSANPKTKNQMASINNVVSGIPDLLKFSDQAERIGATILNGAVIKGGIAFGNHRYSDFNTARTAFADELSGALGYGSATDMSREMGFDMTDAKLSPANFRSAIENVVVPFVARKKASLMGEMGPYAPASPSLPSYTPAEQQALVPIAVREALQGMARGQQHTLSDGSVWAIAADGSISRVR